MKTIHYVIGKMLYSKYVGTKEVPDITKELKFSFYDNCKCQIPESLLRISSNANHVHSFVKYKEIGNVF